MMWRQEPAGVDGMDMCACPRMSSSPSLFTSLSSSMGQLKSQFFREAFLDFSSPH